MSGSGQTSHGSQQTILIKWHHHHRQEEEDHSRSCVSRDKHQARVSLPEAHIRHPEAEMSQHVRHSSPWHGGLGSQWSLYWDGRCIWTWWGGNLCTYGINVMSSFSHLDRYPKWRDFDGFYSQWVPYHEVILRNVNFSDVSTLAIPIIAILYGWRAYIASFWAKFWRWKMQGFQAIWMTLFIGASWLMSTAIYRIVVYPQAGVSTNMN